MRDLNLLPKVELHLHVEGTLEPETVFALAERNGIALPYADLDDLRGRYEFTDLQSFLDLLYANEIVLVKAVDFADMMARCLGRAAEVGVRHAEVFFDPQPHVERGVALEEVVRGLVDGIARAEADHGITAALISCFHRDRSGEDALATLEALVAVEAPLLGIGLDSTEVGNPASKFVDVYRRAAELGLRRVAHAGEEGPASYVTDALDLLGVERVDHGIRAIEDPAVVARLAAERIPLTLCPQSNIRLCCVPSLAEHPLPALMAAGVVCTLNSDDPSYFGGYVDRDYAGVAEVFGFDDETMAGLARNSVTASFLPEERKQSLYADIDAWLQA
ncbi:MAG: adenosine deaminase [Nocardioides sp.]|uniref:adenosine deaminase n=1 Tax=Nocardioides sp. TaxID=35761 RepID=UPI0039E34E9B